MFFPHILTIQELDVIIEIIKHSKSVNDFVLKNKDMLPEKRNWIANQIMLREKARKKHPAFFEKDCFYIEKAIEQSTSEKVAEIKSTFLTLKKDSLICDLTGGMGAETIAFAMNGNKIHYVEQDKDLFTLSNFNFSKLSLNNAIHLHNQKAEDFISQTNLNFDVALLDPDRRTAGERDFTLENSSPNPILLEAEVLKKSNILWIKHSPLIDLNFLIQKFKCLNSIQIISFKNEVKEVCSIHSNVKKELQITCICVAHNGEAKTINFRWEDKNATVEVSDECKKYFFEPDKAIIKSGCVNALAIQYRIKSISIGIPYYTSEDQIPGYPGRQFLVIEELPFNEKKFKIYLKQNAIKKASIGARGFVLKPNEIENKFGLKPSSDLFLFFYKNKNGKMMFANCKQIKE